MDRLNLNFTFIVPWLLGKHVVCKHPLFGLGMSLCLQGDKGFGLQGINGEKILNVKNMFNFISGVTDIDEPTWLSLLVFHIFIK